MKLFKFFLFTSLLLNFSKSFATGQIPDYLITENDTLSLHCNPLESYFEENPLPKDLPMSFSTALWRGYIAYFKIVNNKLVVENIYRREYYTDENGDQKRKLTSIYDKVFKDVKNFECNFYSGVLICPSGDLIEYVHMGYSSTYSSYKLYEINQGSYIKDISLTAQEFTDLKIKHFERYKESEEYQKKLKETIQSFKEMEKEMESEFKEIKRENKKRKKEDKQLFEKEKELEYLKSAENFLYVFTTNNIKTIEVN